LHTLQKRKDLSSKNLPPLAAALVEPVLSGKKDTPTSLDDFLSDHSGDVLAQVIDSLEEALGGGKELLPLWGQVMDWDEARKMADAGVEFGAHTVNHRVLTLLGVEEAEAEIVACKVELERQLKRPIRTFSYCNGWYSFNL
jgi:hypothetical protein